MAARHSITCMYIVCVGHKKLSSYELNKFLGLSNNDHFNIVTFKT